MPSATRRRSTLSPVVLDVLPPPLPPPPPLQSRRRTVKVITLNCWGLLFPASRDRRERVAGIGRALMEWSMAAIDPSSSAVSTSTSTSSSASSPPPDVVCLQEVWSAGDARSIAEAAALGGRLVHSHHFRNGVFGSGLLTLSRFPILQASFGAFAAAGDPLAVLQGDGVAGKGVGCVALDVSCLVGGEGEEEAEARGKRAKAKAKGKGRRGGGRATKEEEEKEEDFPSPSSSSSSRPEVLVVANTHLAAAYKDAHEEGEEEEAEEGTRAGRNGKARKKKTRRGALSSSSSSSSFSFSSSFSSSPSPSSLPFSVPSDANGPVRLAQTIALAESIGAFAASVGARRALLCGDLNAPPRSLEAALLRRLSSSSSGFHDPGFSAETSSSSSPPPPPLGDAWAFLEQRAGEFGFDEDE